MLNVSSSNMKPCAYLKSNEKDISGDYVNMHNVNCKDCIYFSSRNCGRDTITFVEPNNTLFM